MEAIRSLRVVRRSAIKSLTQTINQIRNLIVTAPGEVREKLRGLPTSGLIRQLARSRPGTDTHDPAGAIRIALRRLARRYQYLTEEIADADAELKPLVAQAAPELVALPGIGTETAAQLLITAGDNSDRLRSEASFAHLCAAAPVPASSGRTHRPASTAAATDKPTTPSTSSPWSGCATTHAPATTSPAAPPKGCRRRTSCAASNDSSPARSTNTSSSHQSAHNRSFRPLDDL